jgi:Protein of unknown function (DUF3108)
MPHSTIKWCLSVLLALVCTRYLGAAELAPFEASYAWSWHGATVALSTLKLEHRGSKGWTYSSTSDPRGLGHLYPMHPKLTSELRVTDQGVEPLRFRADGSGEDHDADVVFDWDTGRASGTYEGVKVDMPIKPGIQDDLSVQIELINDLLHGKTPEHLSMIDKNSVREYKYQREGDARLATPFGPIATVIYSSQHTNSPRITRFWCAPTLGYLPMKVEQKRIDKIEWTMDIKALSRP